MLRIETPNRAPSMERQHWQQFALAAALRALQEVQENLADVVLVPPPASADKLRAKAQELVQRALESQDLTSEGPEEPLHLEHSGWGVPIEAAPGVPREIIAADVLDFLASLLGPDDELHWVEDI